MSGQILSGRCLFCGERPVFGGILLRGGIICSACEWDLVNSRCGDSRYMYYMNGLKRIWRCPVI
ncbi:MAG: sigma factor G inhibitor Gin [Bacillota bacterium]